MVRIPKIPLVLLMIFVILAFVLGTILLRSNSKKTSTSKTFIGKIINKIFNTDSSSEIKNYLINPDGTKAISGLFESNNKTHIIFIAKIVKTENVNDKIVVTTTYLGKSGKTHTQEFSIASKTETPQITIGLQNNNQIMGDYTYQTKNLKFYEIENFMKENYVEKIIVFHLLKKFQPEKPGLPLEHERVMNFANSHIDCTQQLVEKYNEESDNEICQPFIYFLRIPSSSQ